MREFHTITDEPEDNEREPTALDRIAEGIAATPPKQPRTGPTPEVYSYRVGVENMEKAGLRVPPTMRLLAGLESAPRPQERRLEDE